MTEIIVRVAIVLFLIAAIPFVVLILLEAVAQHGMGSAIVALVLATIIVTLIREL